MLLQILKHTPAWVFVLFVGLIFLGYLQSRPRRISRARLALLPATMAGLSFLGIWTSFGANATAFSTWVIAVVVVAALCWRFLQTGTATYCPRSRLLLVPGSWVPLILMMCIFFTKYAVAVARAFDPAVGSATGSVVVICALYGLYSGLFLGRAMGTAKAARRLSGELAGDRSGA